MERMVRGNLSDDRVNAGIRAEADDVQVEGAGITLACFRLVPLLLEALSDCVHAIRQFPYQGEN